SNLRARRKRLSQNPVSADGTQGRGTKYAIKKKVEVRIQKQRVTMTRLSCLRAVLRLGCIISRLLQPPLELDQFLLLLRCEMVQSTGQPCCSRSLLRRCGQVILCYHLVQVI